ncbi:carbohydrate-binding family 9-like protein [Gramella sp. AN32]|uniref:Carbohydrate-binding family 9-like protein n=1 Tax=Christiangramia antarctica TaxID=2058158 RepID=A0ABW5X1H6_9FLAO|nr:carbohydrate-binding family 9-like protein [Gramella sp. AN32]MCM4154982.1 carbohydrate-binding family 9-like protein [Gramella sp. AN32]
MKKDLLLFLLILNGFVLFSQNGIKHRSYVAYRTLDSIFIDGIGNEQSWERSSFTQDFIDIEGTKTPKYQTNVKMLWDDTYLYFYAKMEEPHIWAILKQRDTVIFYNNDFEIFIDPDGDSHNYMEFEMNALNTIWDLFIVKPYRERAPIVNNWEIKGLKSAVYTDGTLNNPSDEDKFWSVEVAIPWEVLEEANIDGSGHADTFWRINFSRVNWDFDLENQKYSRKKDHTGNFIPEFNWVWSPQGVINMHEPEHWGYVFFSSETLGNTVEFEIPEDEKIRWWLFELYRKQKAYYKEHGEWAQQIEKLVEEPLEINNNLMEPELENHRSGWNISIESPFTGNSYIITEDGKFLQI